MGEKRTVETKIRWSLEELAEARSKCNQPELAAWIRDLVLDQRKARANPIPTVDPALLRQLAAIGNNLNQIARICNRKGQDDTISVLAVLVGIEREIKELRNDYDIQ